MNEKGNMIAEIGDCARDGISYAQFGSRSAVSFEVFFWGNWRTLGSALYLRSNFYEKK